MPSFQQRAADLEELMDDPACDRELLFRTYAQFSVINPLLARWRTVYRRRIRPLMRPGVPFRLLDVGFGGGDIPRRLDRWARRDGLRLEITAIDPDPRAAEFAARGDWPDTITFRSCDTATLRAEGARFDAVISNAVLHHLDPASVARLLVDSQALATRLVLHNDTVRSALAYALFSTFVAPWLRRSYAAEDGRRTVRRSYRPAELRSLAPTGWRVEPLVPFRQLVVWAEEASGFGSRGKLQGL